MSYRIGLKNGNYLIPKCYWHIPDLPNEHVISIKQATKIYYYSRTALIRKIKACEIIGFKLNHRWYILSTGLVKRYKPNAPLT